MSISIPSEYAKPEKPIIKLTGTKYNTVDGTTTSLSATAQTTNIAQSGLTVTKQGPVTMVGEVTVTLAAGGSEVLSTQDTTHNFVGELNMGTDLKVGDERQIFYTLNGKDPKRSKNYLYREPFAISKWNKTGSDNTIIKARTYYAGVWSDVEKIELRITNAAS